MLQDVCDRELGFRPLNFSIKPVHVANGLARALTRRSYRTDALACTLRRYVVKQNLGVEQERHPNSEILEKYGDAFEAPHGLEPNSQRLSRLRALSLDVLGADGAVFDQEDKSSYTLSNERVRYQGSIGYALRALSCPASAGAARRRKLMRQDFCLNC